MVFPVNLGCLLQLVYFPSNDQQIVHTVLGLADAFNLKVVAEGVEDEVSMNILKDWGCDIAQGYFISRPLPRADLEAWLENSPFGE